MIEVLNVMELLRLFLVLIFVVVVLLLVNVWKVFICVCLLGESSIFLELMVVVIGDLLRKLDLKFFWNTSSFVVLSIHAREFRFGVSVLRLVDMLSSASSVKSVLLVR